MSTTASRKPKGKRPTRSGRSTTSRRGDVSGRRELDLFARFCADVLRLEDGRPFKLEPFQRKMLADLFDGTTETLILLPKKNGKSTMLAALSLYHLCTTPDAECVIVAASRDQAEIMLRQAHGFIRRSRSLQMRLQRKQREIVHRQLGGRVRVLASDVDTVDGVIPTLALVDELHRHKSAELYGIFRDGLGPRSGRMVTISTAGSDEDSPLGSLRRKALSMPKLSRRGAYRCARSADGSFAMHEWALERGADTHDIALVKQANPASWQTKPALRRRRDSPSTTSWQWERFACGIWSDSDQPWIDPEDFDACRGKVRLEDADELYIGLDVGTQNDSTATAVAGFVGDELHVAVRFRIPTERRKVMIADVREDVARLWGEHQAREVAYDPVQFRESAEMLEERGLTMVVYNQNYDSVMGPASENLYELIGERRLVHDGDETLRSHVLSAVARQTERGWRISKKASNKRIDGCIALALAADRASRNRVAAPLPLVEVFG